MKLCKKMIRAYAETRFCIKYYDWYDEDDFPEDMESIVEKDNPFGGGYKYGVQEKYILVKEM